MIPVPTKRYRGLEEQCPRCCKKTWFVFKTGPGLCSYECEDCGADWREPQRIGRIRAKRMQGVPA